MRGEVKEKGKERRGGNKRKGQKGSEKRRDERK